MTDLPPDEPDAPEEPVRYIESNLWKSGLLVHSSTYFPRLVEAAAWKVGKPYTPELLRHVAADELILESIHLPVGEGMDSALATLVNEAGESVDQAVTHVVSQYDPPAPE